MRRTVLTAGFAIVVLVAALRHREHRMPSRVRVSDEEIASRPRPEIHTYAEDGPPAEIGFRPQAGGDPPVPAGTKNVLLEVEYGRDRATVRGVHPKNVTYRPRRRAGDGIFRILGPGDKTLYRGTIDTAWICRNTDCMADAPPHRDDDAWTPHLMTIFVKVPSFPNAVEVVFYRNGADGEVEIGRHPLR